MNSSVATELLLRLVLWDYQLRQLFCIDLAIKPCGYWPLNGRHPMSHPRRTLSSILWHPWPRRHPSIVATERHCRDVRPSLPASAFLS